MKSPEPKVHLILMRPNGNADILIFKEGSEEYSNFVLGLEEEGRGYIVADQVNECLGYADEIKPTKLKAVKVQKKGKTK